MCTSHFSINFHHKLIPRYDLIVPNEIDYAGGAFWLHIFSIITKNHSSPIPLPHLLLSTPDSARIASVGGDRTAYTWDVRTGQVIGRYRGHTEKITCVSYFADGNLLVTGSADKTLRIWDTRMKHQKAQHHQQQQQQQAGGAAGGGGGSYVRERGGVCVQTMSDCVDSVSAVYANDNMGEIICSSIDGCIYSYDVRKGTKVSGGVRGDVCAARRDALALHQ